MDLHFQPNRSPALELWETNLLNALSNPDIVEKQGSQCTIDCSRLERALAADTQMAFTPFKSSAVNARLEELGIHCIASQRRKEAGSIISDPKDYVQDRLNAATLDFYNGAFSNPHCALYLAPTLLGGVIYSNGLLISSNLLSRHEGVIQTFRDTVLTTQAYSGFLGELRRNLLLQYVSTQSKYPEHFDDYAQGLPASERDHHRPFFVEHARAAITSILINGDELPSEMVSLLHCSCGTKVFHNFRYSTLTPWLEGKLRELTEGFESYGSIAREIGPQFDPEESTYSDSTEWNDSSTLRMDQSSQGKTDLLEELIEKDMGRFAACLDLLLFADQGCRPFHNKHLQSNAPCGDAETEHEPSSRTQSLENRDPISPEDVLVAEEGTAPEDPQPPKNSALLQTLTTCTSALLNALGHPGMYTPLELHIPSRISEALRERFQWFPDDYSPFETFYREVVANCFVRFIKNLDFQSAYALMIIAPPDVTTRGEISLPPEIEEPIISNQPLISAKIAERAQQICLSINNTRDMLGWVSVEKDLAELQKAISTFLLPTSHQFSNAAMSRSFVDLVALMAARGWDSPASNQPTSFHQGFTMVDSLLQSFGKSGAEFAGTVFSTALLSSPSLKQEFSGYISACNLLARSLLKAPETNHLLLTYYERRLSMAVRLYRMLPVSLRSSQFASPAECVLTLRQLHRGQALRERLSEFEQSAMNQPREITPFDLAQRMNIARGSQLRPEALGDRIPLYTSQSIISILARGGIEPTAQARSLIGEAERNIAADTIPRLKRTDQKADRHSVLDQIFSTESAVMTSLLLALRNVRPLEIIKSSDLAIEFYASAATKIASLDSPLSESFKRLEKTFALLSTELKAFNLRPDGELNKRQQRKVIQLLRNFVEHHTIQTLMEDLRISS